MGIVGGDEYAERLVLLAAGPDEFLGLLEELFVRVAAEVFEGIGRLRADMGLAGEGHPIAKWLEVLGQALGGGDGVGVIEERLGAPGGASTVELLAERGTHGDRGVCLVELHAVGGHLVDVRRGAIHAPVATYAVAIDVVPEEEDEIGLGEKRGGQREEETERQ